MSGLREHEDRICDRRSSLSNSAVFGMQYLEHALESLKDFLGAERRVLFVPYALADYDGYTAGIRRAGPARWLSEACIP